MPKVDVFTEEHMQQQKQLQNSRGMFFLADIKETMTITLKQGFLNLGEKVHEGGLRYAGAINQTDVKVDGKSTMYIEFTDKMVEVGLFKKSKAGYKLSAQKIQVTPKENPKRNDHTCIKVLA